MPIKKKGTNKKLIIAIVLVAILAIAAVAIIYVTQRRSSSAKVALVGVQVGDSFTYNITGSSSDPVPYSVYPNFSLYNDTAYYKVTVTGIEGTSVTLDTNWVFKNGTDVEQPQTIDLSNGLTTNQNGFWALYPANLNINEPIYPYNSSVTINGTYTQPYASGTRESVYYEISNAFYNVNDPTYSTERVVYDQIYIDRQTGILTSLNDVEEFNNPQLEIDIIWTLTSSTVWSV